VDKHIVPKALFVEAIASPHVLINSIIIPSILYYSNEAEVVYNHGKVVFNPGLILYV